MESIEQNYKYNSLLLVDETQIYQELPLDVRYDIFMNYYNGVM